MGPLNLQLLALFVLGCYVATGRALAQPGLVNTAVYDVVQPLDGVTDDVTNTLDTTLASDPQDTQKKPDNKHYISYGALQRNTVPCSRRGSSYENCKKEGEANKYQRGCSAIKKCRTDTDPGKSGSHKRSQDPNLYWSSKGDLFPGDWAEKVDIFPPCSTDD